jgi:Polyketide cyclase / dehydrase and lipid transport
MPNFTLRQPDPGWVPQAPVTVRRTITLAASPQDVFAVLADLAGWSTWFGAMKRARIDGPASGVGALRTVWVAGTRVQERFLVWEPAERMTFAIVASSVPGLAAMVEDWALSPEPDPVPTPGAPAPTPHTRLQITIGVDPAGPLRHAPKLVHWAMARATRGAAGLTSMFP